MQAKIIDLRTTHQLIKSDHLFCCNCNKKLDGATGGNNVPKHNDVTICLYCGEIMRYKIENNSYILEPVTDEDLKAMERGDREFLLHMQKLIHEKTT